MSIQHARRFSRREFLEGLTLAGTAGLLGLHPRLVAAEPPPETTTLRLVHIPSTCVAPQLIAEELLSAEGFTDVQYLGTPRFPASVGRLLSAGEFDMAVPFLPTTITRIEAGSVETTSPEATSAVANSVPPVTSARFATCKERPSPSQPKAARNTCTRRCSWRPSACTRTATSTGSSIHGTSRFGSSA